MADTFELCTAELNSVPPLGYGAKIDAAMKLKEKGHAILILNELTWRDALSAL